MTKPPFADLCILNFERVSQQHSDFPSDNDQNCILLKLQQMMKKLSEETINHHQNYQQLLCDIKRAGKKKRAIRKVLLKDRSLYSDKRLVLELVNACSRHLQYASQELKQDFGVVMAAVVKCGSCLKYLNSDNALLDDFRIGYQAVKSHGNSFQYLSFNLQNDRRVVMRAVESKLNYSFLPNQFKNDREIMIRMIKVDQYNVSKEFHNDFLDDQEMILQSSVQFCSDIIPKISYRLRNNVQFIVDYTKLHPYRGFEYFPSKFQNNFEFVKRLVASHMNFSAVPEKWKSNEELMKIALKRNRYEMLYFSRSIWENRKFLLEIAELAGVALFKAKPADVTIDREVVKKIILTNPESYYYIPNQRD